MRRITYAQIIIVVMFAIISLFALMLTNSIIESQNDDLYYNEFYSQYMRSFDIKYGKGSDFPYNELGDSYALYFGITETYDRDNDYVRAAYIQGDVSVPNILEGRFFTREEMDSAVPVAVLGTLCKRNVVQRDGKDYYSFGGIEYEVIGYMGREDEVTDLDNMVWLNMGAYFSNASLFGKFYIDGGNEKQTDSAVEKLMNLLPDEIINTAAEIIHERRFRTISYFTQRFYNYIILAVIVNLAIVSVYYMDKRMYLIAVKKFIGASFGRIAAEIVAEYVSFASAGVLLGIVSAVLLKFTSFAESDEVMLMTISIPSVLLMFAITTVCAVAISVLPIIRVYNQDLSENIK